jgi:hypothetical protein
MGTWRRVPQLVAVVGLSLAGTGCWPVPEVTVFVDDGRQADYDEHYGPGAAAVTALLQPID